MKQSNAKKYYRKRKHELNKLQKETKQLWEERCLEFWGEQCEVCGKPVGEVHHFFPKGRCKVLKYDMANGVPLCASCHFKHTHTGDPTIHIKILQKRGLEWYEMLLAKSEQHFTNNVNWLKEQIEKLK